MFGKSREQPVQIGLEEWRSPRRHSPGKEFCSIDSKTKGKTEDKINEQTGVERTKLF